ncbi:MAG: DUF86 domain-containing protein [Candidatus Helarchaeota archaeon]|nr:DUF86 domain-containing protein [Candidatus Helarchaeota archaeon]
MRNNIGDKARLHHILDAISEIEKYTKLKSLDNFIDDTMLQSACIRQLEIIGESANNISDDLKSTSEDIEWGEIIGLRHILIHDYFGVDLNIVWDIIQKDILILKIRILSLLDKID